MATLNTFGITAGAYETEITITRQGFTCEIRDDATYFTIYQVSDSKPVATIHRPRRYDDAKEWAVHDTNGIKLGRDAIGPRTAFNVFLKYRKHQ